MKEMSLSGAVLAGGKSSRMGTDKAFLKWQGMTLLERQLVLLKEAGCRELFIAGREEARHPFPGVRVLKDVVENGGPLAGIAAALRAATSTHVLILPVDAPCVRLSLLISLRENMSLESGVVPVHRGGIEPLVAIYPRKLLGPMKDFLSQGRRAVRGFLQSPIAENSMKIFRVQSEDLFCFKNINTPEDFDFLAT